MEKEEKHINLKCTNCGYLIETNGVTKPITCPHCGKEVDPVEAHNYALADWG